MGKGAVVVGVISGLIAGVAGGVLGTKQFFKDKYEKECEAQIQSARDTFMNAKHMTKEDNPRARREAAAEPNVDIKHAAAAHAEYSGDKDSKEKSEDFLKTPLPKKPYIITVQDYDELKTAGYSAVELVMYSDGVVVSSSNRNIQYSPDQITKMCGNAWRDYLKPGSEEIYIRNEDLKTDVAITLDERKYNDRT